jgi:hypothetical protein
VSVLASVYATALTALYLHGAVPRHRPESGWFAAATLGVLASLLRGDLATTIDRRPEAREATRPWKTWVALVVLCLAAYAGIIGTGLLSDDFVLLERAGAGQLTMGNEFYRPLPLLVWSAWQSVGAGAPLFHLTNVLLHGVNAGLVLAVARAVGLPRMAQFAAAVVFALHPVGVEAVTWISAFPDVLATTGTLVTVLGSLAGSWLMTGVGFAVAVLSKESGVAAPALAIAVCWAAGRQLRLPVVGLGAVVLFVVWRLWFLPLPEEYLSTPSRYLVKELVTRTFGTLAAPWSSGELATFGWALTAATCAACGLVILANARAAIVGPSRIVYAGMLWALLSVAPVYSYLFISEYMAGSRYLYLAGAGWALTVATLVSAEVERGGVRMQVALALAAVIGAGSLLAIQVRQQSWRDAAVVRDEVLESAARVLVNPKCETVAVTGLPDEVRGAFVFRNGFPEALRQRAPDVRVVSSDASCVFEWTAAGFQARATN